MNAAPEARNMGKLAELGFRFSRDKVRPPPSTST